MVRDEVLKVKMGTRAMAKRDIMGGKNEGYDGHDSHAGRKRPIL
jgi:hypothetical protein